MSTAKSSIMSSYADRLSRFVFEAADVRGEIIHLDESYRQVISRLDYAVPVRNLIGEALAAAGLLSSTLKYDGLLSLQIQGGGPLSLLVANATSDRQLRATARVEDALLADGMSLNELCRDGYLAITIDPEDREERYQGIVQLDAENLAGAVDRYFRDSEQLPTRVWLAADGESAAGLLLQRLPGGADDDDAWNRAEHLAQTITSDELLSLEAPRIVRRLFHEEDVRLFEPVNYRFQCTCSRDRVASVIRSLGRDEAEDVLREQGRMEVRCDFCGEYYRFDAVDVEHIFAGANSPTVPRTRH